MHLIFCCACTVLTTSKTAHHVGNPPVLAVPGRQQNQQKFIKPLGARRMWSVGCVQFRGLLSGADVPHRMLCVNTVEEKCLTANAARDRMCLLFALACATSALEIFLSCLVATAALSSGVGSFSNTNPGSEHDSKRNCQRDSVRRQRKNRGCFYLLHPVCQVVFCSVL